MLHAALMHIGDDEANRSVILQLVAHAERLRMEVREVLGGRHAGVIRGNYSPARKALLAAPISRDLAPSWLKLARTSSDAAKMIVSHIPKQKHFIRKVRKVLEDDLAPMMEALEKAAVAYESHEDVIHKRVNLRVTKWFDCPMVVEDRAIQILTTNPDSWKGTVSAVWQLWANAIRLYPAFAYSLESAIGSPLLYRNMLLELYQRDKNEVTYGVSDHFIMGILRRCFFDTRIGRLKSYGEEVRSSGYLSTLNLLEGPLRTPSVGYGEVPPLKAALRGLAPGELLDQQDQVTNALIEALRLVRKLDESSGKQQFIIFDYSSKITVRPSGTWAYCRGPGAQSEQLTLFRGNVAQPSGPFSEESLARLQWLIQTNAAELEFQKFFEEEPFYLSTLGSYSTIHPQLVLTDDAGRKLIPDFFLENFHNGFVDILDLKRPADRIFKEVGGRPQFRDRIASGIRQLSAYRDFFEDRENRKRFQEAYPGLKAFRPRVILVIGRKEDSVSELTKIRLTSELRDWLTLHTYDDVVASAREWQRRVR